VKQVLSTEAGLDVIREGEERDAELAAATKNRKGRKGVKNGSQLDPAKKKVVKNSCWVFFRSASAAENKGYVYCILHSYVGHECKGDGRVAISNWGTPQACLTAFNCVSHLERFHGGRESNVTVDNYWKTIREAGGQGKAIRPMFASLLAVCKPLSYMKQSSMVGFVSKSKKAPGLLEKELKVLIFIVRNKIAFESLNDKSWSDMLDSFDVQLSSAKTIQRLLWPLWTIARRAGERDILRETSIKCWLRDCT
jgi:hypothetical protein